MPIEIDGKTFRNLQEQVGKNKTDIEALKTGIKIDKSVTSLTDIATLTTEENVGKYYLYEPNATTCKLYTITHRMNGGLLADDLGDYPVKGAKGDTGETGATGSQGTRGPGLFAVAVLPSPYDSNYIAGDSVLITVGSNAGVIYKLYTAPSNYWSYQGNIRGAQGETGLPYPNTEFYTKLTEAMDFNATGEIVTKKTLRVPSGKTIAIPAKENITDLTGTPIDFGGGGGGGTKLYKHHIVNSGGAWIEVLSTDSTPRTDVGGVTGLMYDYTTWALKCIYLGGAVQQTGSATWTPSTPSFISGRTTSYFQIMYYNALNSNWSNLYFFSGPTGYTFVSDTVTEF